MTTLDKQVQSHPPYQGWIIWHSSDGAGSQESQSSKQNLLVLKVTRTSRPWNWSLFSSPLPILLMSLVFWPWLFILNCMRTLHGSFCPYILAEGRKWDSFVVTSFDHLLWVLARIRDSHIHGISQSSSKNPGFLVIGQVLDQQLLGTWLNKLDLRLKQF